MPIAVFKNLEKALLYLLPCEFIVLAESAHPVVNAILPLVTLITQRNSPPLPDMYLIVLSCAAYTMMYSWILSAAISTALFSLPVLPVFLGLIW